MKNSTVDKILQAAIVIGLAALVFAVWNSVRDRVIATGDTAPDFSIQTDSGVTVSRADFGGKILVLNFWATWCPPCVEELPSLNRFQERLKNEGVVVLGISVDEDPAAYQKFLLDHGVTFLTARDPKAEISDSYGTYRYPETYVIDAGGKVVQKIIGPAQWTDERMIGYIRSLL